MYHILQLFSLKPCSLGFVSFEARKGCLQFGRTTRDVPLKMYTLSIVLSAFNKYHSLVAVRSCKPNVRHRNGHSINYFVNVVSGQTQPVDLHYKFVRASYQYQQCGQNPRIVATPTVHPPKECFPPLAFRTCLTSKAPARGNE